MTDLIPRLEAATGPDRELDAEIARDIMGLIIHDWPDWIVTTSRMHDFPALAPTPNYTGSVDAALTLVPDGWGWLISTHLYADSGRPDKYLAEVWLKPKVEPQDTECLHRTPALALCVASLMARQHG